MQRLNFLAERTIGGAFKGAIEGIKPLVENIKNIFSGIIDFVKKSGNSGWDAVLKFSNIFKALVIMLKIPLNFMIDIINKFIGGLSKNQNP